MGRGPRGFSLIEVLVSLVIFMTCLIGILQGLLLAAQAVAADTDRQQARALLEAQAATIQVGLLADAAVPPGAGGTFPAPHEAFQWELLSDEQAANGSAHRLALAVAWRRGRREARETTAWDCWIPPASP